jgi:hypothetical protein
MSVALVEVELVELNPMVSVCHFTLAQCYGFTTISNFFLCNDVLIECLSCESMFVFNTYCPSYALIT